MKEYTVKSLANKLKVSKPTVQRAINAAAIKADRVDNKNTGYYNTDKAIQIVKLIKPDFDILATEDRPKNEPKQTETPPQEPKNVAESGENEPKQTETEANEPKNVAKQTETPPQNTTEIALLRDMLDTIKGQLAEKDQQIRAYEAQIAIKDEQIKDYSSRLQEAMQLTKGQQYIAAADKTTELLEANNNIIDPAAADQQQKEKKSIFSWFKKR